MVTIGDIYTGFHIVNFTFIWFNEVFSIQGLAILYINTDRKPLIHTNSIHVMLYTSVLTALSCIPYRLLTHLRTPEFTILRVL